MKHALSFLFFVALSLSGFAADYSVTAANVVPSSNASIRRATAGASITAGQAVAIDSSGLVQLYSSTGSGALHVFAGISVNGAASGQPILFATSDTAFTPGFSIAAGAIVIGSATGGKLCPAGDLASTNYLTIVGVGIGNNQISFAPLAAGIATP
jgi:hypothetical protein